MKITGSKQELALLLKGERALGRTIGFVPTMGALHEGHLSLVSEAVARYDVCVVSIFVNPKQFNNPQDLITYPRQPEQDIALLEKTGCHYLFMPSEEEVYEKDAIERVFDLGAVAQVMEGVRRPGHFEGVALIVSKLFEWVAPDGAFFWRERLPTDSHNPNDDKAMWFGFGTHPYAHCSGSIGIGT